MKPFKERLLGQLAELRQQQSRRSAVGGGRTVAERGYAMIAEEVLGWVVTWAEAQPGDPTTDASRMAETLRRIADKLEEAT